MIDLERSTVPRPGAGTAEHAPTVDGTPHGTPVERTSLKALARKVLQAEHPAEHARNTPLETRPEQRSIEGNSGTPSGTRAAATTSVHAQRHRLLALAREMGIPRLVIAELPDAEIEGCQYLTTDGAIRRYAQILLENWLTARGVHVLYPTDPTEDLKRYRITHPQGA